MIVKILKYCLFFFLMTSQPVMAQKKLEVIPLNNRQVEEVIPVVRPLLGPGESISGMRQQLIVRASPRKLKEIKSILMKIDARLKNLRITVMQGSRSQLNELEKELEAKIPIGDSGRVIINSRDNKSGGLVIDEGIGDGSIRGRLLQKDSYQNESNTQVVTTLEGSPAAIYFTQRIPFKEKRKFRKGNKFTELETTQFKDVRSGFTVLPKISGDNLVLEISPQQSRVVNGDLETVGLNTVIRGRVGEWMELGGLDQKLNKQSSGVLSRNTSRQEEKRSVFIKVEEQ